MYTTIHKENTMGKSWKRLVQRRRRAASEVEVAPVVEEAVAPAPAKAAPVAAPAPKKAPLKAAPKAQPKTSKKSK